MAFTVLRVVLFVAAIVGTTFLFPIAACVVYGELDYVLAFVVPMLASWALGGAALFAGRGRHMALSARGSFVVVALSWLAAGAIGAIPLRASGVIPDAAGAFFESVSGFTTTGATVLSEVESLPHCINLWRCQMHWLGGMGIVALTVALLPLLGVGGFQLIKAETTGPDKGKFTPRIATTAKILWFIYVGMTALEVVMLKLAGMSFFDAVCHSFSTLGTGGFSTHNASVASFNSAAIDWICFVFMVLAGVNFSLYFYLFTGDLSEVRNNSELKAYFTIIVSAILAITLLERGTYGGFFKALRYSAFQVSSIMTTTGFSTADYTKWSSASQVIMLALFLVGGCAGSTAGGIKVIRWVILSKQLKNETLRMLHPRGIFSVRINQKPARGEVIFSVAAFIFLYFAFIVLTSFVGALSGMDLLTAFTGAVTMIDNCGPAFGALGPSFNCGWLAPAVKWWYSFTMLAGRLELFTMLIFFSPSFWRH